MQAISTSAPSPRGQPTYTPATKPTVCTVISAVVAPTTPIQARGCCPGPASGSQQHMWEPAAPMMRRCSHLGPSPTPPASPAGRLVDDGRWLLGPLSPTLILVGSEFCVCAAARGCDWSANGSRLATGGWEAIATAAAAAAGPCGGFRLRQCRDCGRPIGVVP